jgi:heme-degrading monooxygenase HmoA/predicted lactoylglutathione lyase
MTVAPRLTLVTLGVDDVLRSEAFYRALGWDVVLSDADEFRLFRTAGAWLALYSRASLQRDMGRDLAPGSASMNPAINLDSPADVDAALATVAAAGGEVVTAGHAMDWGGYSSYIADPDGHIWEIAHNPAWPITLDGRVDVTGEEDVVVIFRSRRRDEDDADYADLATKMFELAESMPGYIWAKTYTAEDGEHVTIARFDTAEQERAWRDNAEHRAAQKRGREKFYSSYDIARCMLVDERSFTAK